MRCVTREYNIICLYQNGIAMKCDMLMHMNELKWFKYAL